MKTLFGIYVQSIQIEVYLHLAYVAGISCKNFN